MKDENRGANRLMPLDLIEGVTMLHSSREDRDSGAETGPIPSLASGPDIGAALKSVREFRGLTLENVSDITRVRPTYLAALEEMRLADLPSRPFVIGYLRAYADALGLDPDAAVTRFRAEQGAGVAKLNDPVGVSRQGDPRLAAVAMAGVVIIAAVLIWNVARRAMQEDEPKPQVVAEAPVAPAVAAPVSLGEPLPAPAESTRPDLYVTPGLADATAAGGAADAVAAARKARAAAGEIAVETGPAASPKFVPGGEIYGTSTPGAPVIILQARRPAALVVQSGGGAVHFARQMAAGEAYRVPVLPGLATDVSDPSAFAVYVDGVLSGPLPAAKTPLARLAPAGPPR
jgi:transcriptional regulator with XRE-family HTH domain